MSPFFYSSPQNGAFSSSYPIFQKIVQSKKKKKIQLFLDRTCTFVLAPVFNTSHREWSFSCALDGQVKNCTSDRETAGKIVFVLYYLKRTCRQLSFSISIKSFCKEAFLVSDSCLNIVLMSNIRCFSKNYSHTSESCI